MVETNHTKLGKEAKNDFEKDFLKLMNNDFFGKAMENVRKHKDIKLVTTDKRRNQLPSEPNSHTPKHFSENLSATEMKKAKVKMHKPIYLGMSILDINEFWQDYTKPEYRNKAKLFYMDTDSFVIHIKTKDFFEDVANDVEEWFGTSNCSKDDKRPLPVDQNKKKKKFFFMKEFVGLRAKI